MFLYTVGAAVTGAENVGTGVLGEFSGVVLGRSVMGLRWSAGAGLGLVMGGSWAYLVDPNLARMLPCPLRRAWEPWVVCRAVGASVLVLVWICLVASVILWRGFACLLRSFPLLGALSFGSEA